jgi:hypothetical protein
VVKRNQNQKTGVIVNQEYLRFKQITDGVNFFGKQQQKYRHQTLLSLRIQHIRKIHFQKVTNIQGEPKISYQESINHWKNTRKLHQQCFRHLNIVFHQICCEEIENFHVAHRSVTESCNLSVSHICETAP